MGSRLSGVNLLGRLLKSSSRGRQVGGRENYKHGAGYGGQGRGGPLSLPLVCALDLQGPS